MEIQCEREKGIGKECDKHMDQTGADKGMRIFYLSESKKRVRRVSNCRAELDLLVRIGEGH